jgi:hypothetical protein
MAASGRHQTWDWRSRWNACLCWPGGRPMKQCRTCGGAARDGKQLCVACHEMLAGLPSRIQALIKLRELIGCSIHEGEELLAASALHERVAVPIPRPQHLVQKLAEHETVAIEALWDGDTSGWFVNLIALCRSRERNALYDVWLATLRDPVGDLRLFNGVVPPWPESISAGELGCELANRLGVPFHFPSPQHSEDDCPRWLQRHLASPCKHCGILLLQPDGLAWKGACHHCSIAERGARSEPS